MITFARNFVDSVVSRIILIIIVLAFLFYGIFDAIRLSYSEQDTVKFKFVDNVKSSEFFNLKNSYIKNLSSQNINVFELNEETSKQIDSFVLEKLINNRLVKYLSNLYNLQASEEFLRSRERDFTENQQMLYAVNYLKNNFAITGISDVFNAFCIQQTFMNSYSNSLLSNEIQKFFSETRTLDNFYLSFNDVKIIKENITEIDLENFYNENKNLFTKPEKRNIEYIVINFDGDKSNKFDNIKKIDDEVASGKDLSEIASQYNQKILKIDNVTLQQVQNHQNSFVKNSTNEIFDLSENETSYPKEIEESVILFKVKSIEPSKLEKLFEIKNDVFNSLIQKIKINEGKKIIANFKDEATKDAINVENIAKKYNMKKISTDIKISRKSEKYKNEKNLSEANVFGAKLGDFSDTYTNENGIGLFLFKSSRYDDMSKDQKKSKDGVKDKSNDDKEIFYKNLVQISVFEDLLRYVRNINDIKIDKNLSQTNN